MKKKIIIVAILVILITALGGIGFFQFHKNTRDIEPEKITLLNVTGDPASYVVYVLTPTTWTYYDFTEYWVSAKDGFSYFENELPPDGTYQKEEAQLAEGEWDSIVNAIKENDFASYPEDMGIKDSRDGSSTYIEVLTNDRRYFSGGANVTSGKSRKCKGFWNICGTIYAAQIIKDDDPEFDPEAEAARREAYDEAYAKYVEYKSPKAKEEIQLDEESQKLYDDFIAGKASAEYDKSGDIGEYICLWEALEDQRNYTLQELCEKVTSETDDAEDWKYDIVEEKYIDAGLDDTYELVLTLGAAEFNLSLVVKNVDGNLRICFAGDSWSRNQVEINFAGAVSSYGSSGAISHSGQDGYIDKDGKYHLWYKNSEEGYEFSDDGYLYIEGKQIGSDINMWLDNVTFDDDSSYYYIYIVDEDYEEIPEDASNPNDPYMLAREALESKGYNMITADEAAQLKGDKKNEIGYPTEVLQYGIEYMPEY